MEGIRAISGANGGEQLTAEEMAQVAKMIARDRDVRAHEALHLAAAGGMASGVEYTYETGPDGKMYALGGKVSITMTPSRTPEETLAKARQLRAAADAPSDHSGQDMAVAARASAMEAKALQAISKEHAASGPDPIGLSVENFISRSGPHCLNWQ
jgi:SprA-related family